MVFSLGPIGSFEPFAGITAFSPSSYTRHSINIPFRPFCLAWPGSYHDRRHFPEPDLTSSPPRPTPSIHLCRVRLPARGTVRATNHCGRSRCAKANYTIATGQSRARNEFPLSCPDAIAAQGNPERGEIQHEQRPSRVLEAVVYSGSSCCFSSTYQPRSCASGE